MLYFIASVLIIISSLVVFLYLKKKAKKSVSGKLIDKCEKKEIVFFLILLIFGLAMRLIHFGIIPYGMNQDEAMAAVDARALSQYATDRYGMYMPVHFTAWGYGQMSVLLSYCMIPFIKTIGFTPLAIRLPLLIFSMFGMVAVYVVCREAFRPATAYIALLVVAVNPWHYMQSRWAIDCNMFPHVFVIGLMFLVLSRRKKICLYISMIFFALAMYTYGIALYTVPIFLIMACVYMIINKHIGWRELLVCVAVYLAIAWPFIAVMMINMFKWPTLRTPFFTAGYFEESIRSNDILFFSDNPMRQLANNIIAFFNVFLKRGGLNCNYISGIGPIQIGLMPFAVLGFVRLIIDIYLKKAEKQSEKRMLKFFILAFLFIGVIAGIFTNSVNTNRVNIVFYPMLICIAYGIDFVLMNSRILALGIGTIVTVLSVVFFNRYFTDYTENYKALCYIDFMEAVEYLETTGCQMYTITPDSQGYGTNKVSEIMTLYTLDIDAKYFQNIYADENGLMYSDKFRYERASDCSIELGKSRAYVISVTEEGLFNREYFDVAYFGNFAVAYPNTK